MVTHLIFERLVTTEFYFIFFFSMKELPFPKWNIGFVQVKKKNPYENLFRKWKREKF